MDDEPMRLRLVERILLHNQYMILKKLYPEDADAYEERCTILECGYEAHFDELEPMLSEGHLPADQSRYVIDVLDMYRALGDSFRQLGGAVPDVDRQAVTFRGFDGNHETALMGYARFLVLVQHRWEEVLDGRPHFDFNSHWTHREQYERMLAQWTATGRKYSLSADELRAIVGAWTGGAAKP